MQNGSNNSPTRMSDHTIREKQIATQDNERGHAKLNVVVHADDLATPMPTVESCDIVPVAQAIDFLPHGLVSTHQSCNPTEAEYDKPSFECPVAPNSIRVIFYTTNHVFPESLLGPRSGSVYGLKYGNESELDSKRSLMNCEKCSSSSRLNNSKVCSFLSILRHWRKLTTISLRVVLLHKDH